ncbi:uncharacterized protein [Palaemon carinicauda]|uniref:uncharacterized protein n=1 Tax=Palaemon carinicauda TaxID=392227 RepID=UPI0035B62C37
MYLLLSTLMATLLIAFAATDHTDYSIKTTSNWTVSSLNVPECEDAILAVKRIPSDRNPRFHLYVDGNIAYNASCNWKERWNAISISKEWVDLPFHHEGTSCKGSHLPEAFRKLTGRSIVVTSETTTDWQLIPLPVPDGESRRTSCGSTALIDLPARDSVFLLYRPDDRQQSNFEFSLYTNEELVSNLSFTSKPIYGWDMIEIYEERIDLRYKKDVIIPNGSRTLQGRQIKVSSEASIQWQMFSLPFEPVESKEQERRFNSSPLWLVITTISFLYLLTLTAGGLYIRRLKESSRRSEGPSPEPVIVETPSKIVQPMIEGAGDHEEALYEEVGDYEEATHNKARNYKRYMHADSRTGQPAYGNSEYSEPIYGNSKYSEPIYGNSENSEPIYGNSENSQPIYVNPGNSKNMHENPSIARGPVRENMKDADDYLDMGRLPLAPHANHEKLSVSHNMPQRNTENHIRRHQPLGRDNYGYMIPKHKSCKN